jgi:crotonobetainyl-CoA:carnitine CoA-transferase CaiB-like acyl-CoA transferase
LVEQIGTPFRISDVEPGPHCPAGLPGADRDAILSELGFDAATIARLDAAGLFSSSDGAAR